MIALDIAALMAIVRDETQASACIRALAAGPEVLISAGTLAEALIVAARRGFAEEMERLINKSELDVVAVTRASVRRAADAYARWGRGAHPAALNYGDCFPYALAKEYSCPLLFVGEDFSKTDLDSVL